MDRELFTVVEATKGGYAPVYDYGQWRIAMTNDDPTIHRENLKTFGKHLETDEAFILLEGEAYLLLGDGDEEIGNISRHDLEKGKVFVVKKGTWHINVTNGPARILIVENRDTNATNTVKRPIPPGMLD